MPEDLRLQVDLVEALQSTNSHTVVAEVQRGEKSHCNMPHSTSLVPEHVEPPTRARAACTATEQYERALVALAVPCSLPLPVPRLSLLESKLFALVEQIRLGAA